MTSKRVDITLRNERAERIEEIKQEIEDELGYAVGWPKVVDEMVRDYDGR